MNVKTGLRLAALIMLIIAVVFVLCAIFSPTLGSTIYIGKFEFGAEQWRICYKIYALVMVCLFSASFFVNGKSDKRGGA